MNRDSLQRALIDLGWLSLIQRALGGKPSSSYALYQLLRSRGRWVTMQALADEYATAAIGGRHVNDTPAKAEVPMRAAIVSRIARLRGHLADLGVEDAIQTCADQHAYMLSVPGADRVEVALLYACGIELEAAA